MSESSGKIEWYLAREGQQHGPLSEAELNKFIELGHLKPMDLLWRAGFDDWRPATDVFPPRAPEPPAPEPPTPARSAAPTSLDANTQANQTQSARQASPSHGTAAPHETTQPIRQHSLSTADQMSPEARPAPAGEGPISQPGADFHQEAPRADQRPTFDAGHPAGVQAPGQAPIQHAPNAGQPHQPGPIQAASPSLSGDPSPAFGPTHHGPSAVTQRPTQSNPSFGAAPQSTALRPAASPAAAAQPDALDDDEFLEDEEEGRSGWLMVAAALFLFVLLGAGGLFAYNNQQQISALYADLIGDVKKNDEIAVVRAPERATREAAKSDSDSGTTVARLSPPKPVAPENKLPELPILKSKLWQFAQKEFGPWTENRLAELGQQQRSTQEANNYLVASFVRLRRENAQHAMLASPDSLARVAASFVESLQALTAKGPNACYAFISNGESTPEVAPLYFEPTVGPKLEAQMLAILQAIAEGKASPGNGRPQPTAEDFNALSAALAKRGWTAADLKLFSDPTALSKAEPKLVCRLVTEWFATQTKLSDQATRDELIAASLRPVIGG